MKQFIIILKFELAAYFKNKSFILLTGGLMVLLALFLFSPMYIHLVDDIIGGDSENKLEEIMISGDIELDESELILLNTTLAAGNATFVEVDYSVEQMKEAIQNKEYSRGIYLESYDEYTEVVGDTEIDDILEYVINEAIQMIHQINLAEEYGVEYDEIMSIINPSVNYEVIQIGVNEEENFLYTYIMIFILYIAVIAYGQFVVSGIVVEKTSRAMELLVTSASPSAFIFAKVMATAIVGLLQIGVLLASAYAFYMINFDAWQSNMLVTSLFNFPAELIGYVLLFFILGFVFYAFIFGAAGSLCSKVEDMGSLITPITFVFVGSFMLTIFNMMSGVNSTIMTILSYIPFSSPMAMFVRVAMSEISIVEVLSSVGILIISILFTGWLAAKIYRYGVFFYGNSPSLFKVIKHIITSNKK